MEFVFVHMVCILLTLDVGTLVGGACEVTAVTSCNELCTPSLRKPGVVEVRFDGIWANIHCLPPNVRVRVLQNKKKFCQILFASEKIGVALKEFCSRLEK